MCIALAIIMARTVYIIGEQQKISGLRHHRQGDNKDKVSRVLRFMSPVSLPDMREEEEVNSYLGSTGQFDTDHEKERNLGKRKRKKKQRKKRKNKKQKKDTYNIRPFQKATVSVYLPCIHT